MDRAELERATELARVCNERDELWELLCEVDEFMQSEQASTGPWSQYGPPKGLADQVHETAAGKAAAPVAISPRLDLVLEVLAHLADDLTSLDQQEPLDPLQVRALRVQCIRLLSASVGVNHHPPPEPIDLTLMDELVGKNGP